MAVSNDVVFLSHQLQFALLLTVLACRWDLCAGRSVLRFEVERVLTFQCLAALAMGGNGVGRASGESRPKPKTLSPRT